MSLFKVEFKNNNAISGHIVYPGWHDDLKEFGVEGKKQIIKWYIVDAENEPQAIDIANKVVRRIWGSILDLT